MTYNYLNVDKKKGIFWKIFQIQHQVEKLKKKEQNNFHNYRFFNEFQLFETLKHLLEEFKVLILISDDLSQPFIHEISENKKEHYIKYLKKIEIIDVENNNEKVSFNFWSCANHNDLAKAKGASDTYTNKYALSKLFLIPVENEKNDPDYI